MKNYLVLALTLTIAACSQPAPTTDYTRTMPDSIATDSNMTDPNTTAPTALDQQQLRAYSWQLVNATDAKGHSIDALFKAPEPNKPIILTFTPNHVAIKNLLCNIHGLNIDFQNNQFSVKQPIVATMMGCPAEIEKMEQTLVRLLSSKPSLDISGSTEQPVLTLMTAKQEKLVFKGVPTPETKYGVQAETIFLEVAPHTKTCNAGVRQMQCLQVRPVTYDQQGLKSDASNDWQNFYDPIEGYTHDSNQRVILRVKKYAVSNPPADASSYAYILDMVVEQEIAK
ncbi:MAG: DUF4377 domain-containing protein [Moraxellaceae bacterium]|nr:MAG: DUF4377 domain-containing protein [Moraxellaceae bacterium]